MTIILSESDPEGCAACSARTYPQNAYRNGLLYPAYTAAAMAKMIDLADRHQVNLEGMLTWAFEFEDQLYFDGFRTLATNGIDKPILNLFRMAGLLGNRRVQSSPGAPALATRSARDVTILIWNYNDDELPAPPAQVRLNIAALPLDIARALIEHYRIDETHSNAYSAWKRMDSPQNPTPEQYAELEATGQLQLLESPRWISIAQGAATLEFPLPRHAVSLVRVLW